MSAAGQMKGKRMQEDLKSRLRAFWGEELPETLAVTVVYVGASSTVSQRNFRFGLEGRVWGWKENPEYPGALKEGSVLVFAFGGGDRSKVEDWLTRSAIEVHICLIKRGLYLGTDLLWEDEQDRVLYRHRISYEILASYSEVEYSTFPSEVLSAIQRSMTRQSRAEFCEAKTEEFFSSFDSATKILIPKPVPVVPRLVPEVKLQRTSLTKPISYDLSTLVNSFALALKESHLDYGNRHEQMVRRFLSSLVTKRFLILTGLSGSGKTKMAQAFGEWIGAGHSRIVPVRPDWTSPDSLLGYQNQLAEPIEGQQPWEVPGSLELMLRAIENPGLPYLLVFDEMNLAHVERYFADVLSGLESDEPVVPNLVMEQGKWIQKSGEPALVPFPRNLFVVGTVNVDETTYMFSPKVIDRANTIEFRVKPNDLGRTTTKPTPLSAASAGSAESFLAVAESSVPLKLDSMCATWIKELHAVLYEHGKEFGHRSFAEMLEFRNRYMDAGGTEGEAFDVQVYQKVLPRINGSRKELGPPLEELEKFCKDHELALSAEKIERMKRLLEASHFASFAEC